MRIYVASASALPHLEVVEHYIRELNKLVIRVPDLSCGGLSLKTKQVHEITHDWTKEVRLAKDGSPEDPQTRLRAVMNDLAGVRSADLVWLIAPPTDSKSTGAWIEMTYAYDRGIPVIASGDIARCIFADVMVTKKFETHDDAFQYIKGL